MDSNKTGIVHLWDLPSEEIYVKLKNKYFERLMKNFHETFNNSHKIMAREIDKYPGFISALEYQPTANSLDIIIKICNLLFKRGFKGFDLINLEKQVIYLKAKGTATILYNPKLPFNFNNEFGGRIISAVLHDGSLTDSRFTYANYQNILKKKVYKAVKEVFGDLKAKIRFNQVKFSKIIYLVLTSCLRMRSGEKVLSNSCYPKFVFNSKDCWKSIIDQAISDDGWFSGGNVGIVLTVDVTKSKRIPKTLIGNKIIFNKLRININGPSFWKKYKLSIKGKKFIREQWYISISGKKDLEKVSSLCISHPRKNRLLKQYISLIKQEQFRHGENLYVALNACKALYEDNQKIIINNVAGLIKRHPWRTSEILKKMVDLEWLEIIREYENKFNPRIYKITEKGWKIPLDYKQQKLINENNKVRLRKI